MASPLIQIDLWRLLQARLGRKGKLIPHFLVRPFEKLIRQRQLNEVLRKLYPTRGEAFCQGVLRELDIRLSVDYEENMPENPRSIFVCNHPLGGLDGMCVISFLHRHYGMPIRVVVNDLLTAVDPLGDIFLPVNKFGSQHRESVSALNEALESPYPVLFFPAGLVSRLTSDGSIRDLEWNRAFVTKAHRYHRSVVPLFFEGRNTDTFYRAGYWRRKLHIKTNVEQTLLPREVFLGSGSRYRIVVGKPIPWESFRAGAHAADEAAAVCDRVYQLSELPPQNTAPIVWK